MDSKGPFLIKNPSLRAVTPSSQEKADAPSEAVPVYLKVGPKSKSRENRTIDVTIGEKDASRFYVKYVREKSGA